MQLTCSPVYSITLFTFNFSQPLPEPAYIWTTPDYKGLENRPRELNTECIYRNNSKDLLQRKSNSKNCKTSKILSTVSSFLLFYLSIFIFHIFTFYLILLLERYVHFHSFS